MVQIRREVCRAVAQGIGPVAPPAAKGHRGVQATPDLQPRVVLARQAVRGCRARARNREQRRRLPSRARPRTTSCSALTTTTSASDGENSLSPPSSVGKVHPGADDNASGVAAILEFARAQLDPRRGAAPRPALPRVRGPRRSGCSDPVTLGGQPDAAARERRGHAELRHGRQNPEPQALCRGRRHRRAVRRSCRAGSLRARAEGRQVPAAPPAPATTPRSRPRRSLSCSSSRGCTPTITSPATLPTRSNGEAAVDLLGVADRIVHGIEALDDRLAFVDKAPESGHGRPSGGRGERRRLRTLVRLDPGLRRGAQRRQVR